MPKNEWKSQVELDLFYVILRRESVPAFWGVVVMLVKMMTLEIVIIVVLAAESSV